MKSSYWRAALAALLFEASVLANACGGHTSTVAPSPQSVAVTSQGTGSGALPEPGTYELDPPHTFVSWAARHKVVGTVRGHFDKITGTILVARDPAACGVDVSIEAPSISTQNSIRDDDLRSASFFGAAKFPTITYRGRGIHSSDAGWVIDGVLTIRGIARVVPVQFTFRGVAPPHSGSPERLAFRAHALTKRADFGMTRELLDEVGANAPGVDVEIDLDAEALSKSP